MGPVHLRVVPLLSLSLCLSSSLRLLSFSKDPLTQKKTQLIKYEQEKLLMRVITGYSCLFDLSNKQEKAPSEGRWGLMDLRIT